LDEGKRRETDRQSETDGGKEGEGGRKREREREWTRAIVKTITTGLKSVKSAEEESSIATLRDGR